MEDETPQNWQGCESVLAQLTSRMDSFESMLQKAFHHIKRLDNEVKSLRQERDFFKEAAIRLLSGGMAKDDSPNAGRLQTVLPENLNTEKAHILWKRLKTEKLIDDQYQPLVSAAKAAVIADVMGKILDIDIRCRWKDFQLLWDTGI